MSEHRKYDWDQNTLSSRKLMAWAFAVGERPGPAGDASARSHRGMLPDVDYGRVMTDPNHRSLLKRLADWLRGLLPASPAAAAEAGLSARLAADVDESLSSIYSAKRQPNGHAIRSDEDNTDQIDWSRAA